MRRAFFFIVAVCLATSSFASIPRASTLNVSSPSFDALSETRIRVSEDLAPFERPAPSLLSRALRQAYEQASTTSASGLAGFLSVDPVLDITKATHNPQNWNRYTYVMNKPINRIDPDGRDDGMVGLTVMQDCQLNDCRPNWEEDRKVAAVGMSLMPYIGPAYSFLSALAGRDPISGDEISGGWRAAGIIMGPLGGGRASTTLAEAKQLVGAWGKGTFPTLAKTIGWHFSKHGAEVGAKNVLQYMRKAFEFNRNLRGAEKVALENGATRYVKNGYYIIKDEAGRIVSYGRVTQ